MESRSTVYMYMLFIKFLGIHLTELNDTQPGISENFAKILLFVWKVQPELNPQGEEHPEKTPRADDVS